MKHLYSSLAPCAKEEEVKAEFCKFFKMKIFALRGIDHYAKFYASRGDRYDWDRAPSSPCPKLVGDILAALTGTTGVPPVANVNGKDARSPSLRAAHDALRAKLLPQVYSLGFLNPDVEYFE